MNPITLAVLLFGGYLIYTHGQAQIDAAKKSFLDVVGTDPVAADVLAFCTAVNPSGFISISRFDDCDKIAVFNILKKYQGDFAHFTDLFKKYTNKDLVDAINTKLILSDADKQTFFSIINGTVTAAQQMPYTQYSGSTVPTGKTITFLAPAYLYFSDDIQEDISDQLPDLNNPDETTGQKQVGEKTYTLKTTGRFFDTSHFYQSSNVYAQLATDDLKMIRWVCVVDNAGTGKPLISYNA